VITDLRSIPAGRIALYGFGAVGHFLFSALARDRPDINIVCIIDDGKTGNFRGIPIVSSEQAAQRQPVFEHVLISGLSWKTMARKLEDLGINNFSIVDPLRAPAAKDEMTVEVGGRKILFSTPNKLSQIVAESILSIEPDTIRWIDSFKRGSCFYDVGASNGIFALYSAIVKDTTVVAFEPDALNFALLSKNRVLNYSQLKQPFTALQIALADHAGTVCLVSHDLPYEGAHGKFSNAGARLGEVGREILYVQPTLVDSLSSLVVRYRLPEPDYLKIDVDGAEFAVLAGTAALLDRCSIKEILIETEDRLLDRLAEFMRPHGYVLRETHRINEMVGGVVHGVSNFLFCRHAQLSK
jgi:FkbM family methyltransferase